MWRTKITTGDSSRKTRARRLGTPGILLAKLVAIASLEAGAGCGDDALIRVFSSEHFDYYRDAGAAPPCEGTAYWLERHYSAYAEFLGVQLPIGQKIRYRLVSNRAQLEEEGCGNGASGCSEGTDVLSTFSLFSHEVVHAVASLAGGPPAFLREGIAVVLGEVANDRPDDPRPPEAPLEELVESAPFWAHVAMNGFGVYRDAGGFVRFLLDQLGRDRFLSLYRGLSGRAARADIERGFSETYGLTLADAFAMWRARPPEYRDEASLHVVECAEAAVAAGQTTADVGRCGYLSYSFGGTVIRPFEVSGAGAVLTAVSDAQASVRVFSCSGGDVLGGTLLLNGWGIDASGPVRFLLGVPPGRYFVAMAQGQKPSEDGSGQHEQSEIRLQVDEMPQRARCESPVAFLGDESRAYAVTRWASDQCSTCSGPAVALSFEVGGRLEYYAPSGKTDLQATTDLVVCRGNCGGAEISGCVKNPVAEISGPLGTYPAGSLLDVRGTLRPDSGLRGFGIRVSPLDP